MKKKKKNNNNNSCEIEDFVGSSSFLLAVCSVLRSRALRVLHGLTQGIYIAYSPFIKKTKYEVARSQGVGVSLYFEKKKKRKNIPGISRKKKFGIVVLI